MVTDKGGAIALMIAALCFLGTWPAILNSLERKGRLLQHTYLDYSLTNFLGAVLFAFTLGQIGSAKPESPNFLTQLGQVCTTDSPSPSQRPFLLFPASWFFSNRCLSAQGADLLSSRILLFLIPIISAKEEKFVLHNDLFFRIVSLN